MNIQNINPYVRFIHQKEGRYLQGLLQAADHRIFYCHSGSGQYEAGGQLYPFTPGTLIYLPAGTPYRFLFELELPVFSGCNFDFYQDHAHLTTPIFPLLHNIFRSEDILEPRILQNTSAESSSSDDTPFFSGHLHLENVFFLEERVTELAEEFRNHNLFYDVRCSALLKELLVQIARLASTRSQGINRKKADEILEFIRSHYELPLSNREIAAHFNYHENYISTLILKYTGLPLHQYVLNYKMHMAIILLQSTTLSIGEVAVKVGIPDLKHFSKCFKKMIGYPPSQLRT